MSYLPTICGCGRRSLSSENKVSNTISPSMLVTPAEEMIGSYSLSSDCMTARIVRGVCACASPATSQPIGNTTARAAATPTRVLLCERVFIHRLLHLDRVAPGSR
jgi:hypothetical protein